MSFVLETFKESFNFFEAYKSKQRLKVPSSNSPHPPKCSMWYSMTIFIHKHLFIFYAKCIPSLSSSLSMTLIIITSNSVSGFQITKSASIPGLSDPLRFSSLLKMAGFLHISCTRSCKENPLGFAEVQNRGRPVQFPSAITRGIYWLGSCFYLIHFHLIPAFT